MNKILFYLDQEAHEPLFLSVYSEDWQKALDALSGEGADTQLVNALDALGFNVFDKVLTADELAKAQADGAEDDDNDDDSDEAAGE